MSHKFTIDQTLRFLQYLSLHDVSNFMIINHYCKECVERITEIETSHSSIMGLLDQFPLIQKIKCKTQSLPTSKILPTNLQLSILHEFHSPIDSLKMHINNIKKI